MYTTHNCQFCSVLFHLVLPISYCKLWMSDTKLVSPERNQQPGTCSPFVAERPREVSEPLFPSLFQLHQCQNTPPPGRPRAFALLPLLPGMLSSRHSRCRSQLSPPREPVPTSLAKPCSGNSRGIALLTSSWRSVPSTVS